MQSSSDDEMHERDVGDRQDAVAGDDVHPLVVDQPVAEMLHAVPVIGPWILLQRLLKRAQRHVHRDVADGVNAHPVAGAVIGVDGFV